MTRACRKVRGLVRAYPMTTGFVLLAVYITAVGGWAYNRFDSNDRAINGNRVEQTRQSCRERNEERAIFRASFTRQIEQTRLVPAEAFELFNVTKREALVRLRGSRAALHPLDCKARVRAVRAALD